MAFTDDLAVFFNADEFGTIVTINGKPVTGIFSYGYVLVNEVEMRKPLFTCAEAEIAPIRQGASVQLKHYHFKTISPKPDGLGCITLVLENIANEAC